MATYWGSTFISDAVHKEPYLWHSSTMARKPSRVAWSCISRLVILLLRPSQSGQAPTAMVTVAAPFRAKSA